MSYTKYATCRSSLGIRTTCLTSCLDRATHREGKACHQQPHCSCSHAYGAILCNLADARTPRGENKGAISSVAKGRVRIRRRGEESFPTRRLTFYDLLLHYQWPSRVCGLTGADCVQPQPNCSQGDGLSRPCQSQRETLSAIQPSP